MATGAAESWYHEKQSAWLYGVVASAEPDPVKRALFGKLASAAENQATCWLATRPKHEQQHLYTPALRAGEYRLGALAAGVLRASDGHRERRNRGMGRRKTPRREHCLMRRRRHRRSTGQRQDHAHRTTDPRTAERGLTVSTIKHTHHHHIELDTPGKDSHRHRLAGASEVIVASDTGWARIAASLRARAACPILLAQLRPVDVVLVEGFKQLEWLRRVEVFRGEGTPLALADPGIAAVAAPGGLPPAGLPRRDAAARRHAGGAGVHPKRLIWKYCGITWH